MKNGPGQRAEGMLSREAYQEAAEAYQEAAEPYFEAKRRVYATVMPTCVIAHDGGVTFQYNFTAEQQEHLRLLDEALDATRAAILKRVDCKAPHSSLDARN